MTLRLLTFDLDNTLWDVDTVIRNAEQMMRAWLGENVPEVVALYDGEGIADIRAAVMKEHPEMRHDLSRFRVEIVKRSIQATGRSAAEAERLAIAAFDVFYEGRHRVSYFEHALETLEALSNEYTLAALSNGNADVFKLGLASYFSFSYSAADVGASKPAPDMFHAALARAGVNPNHAVHIGDHLDDDIRGAQDVGMHTIWVNLQGQTSDLVTPSQSVTDLSQLPLQIDRINQEISS